MPALSPRTQAFQMGQEPQANPEQMFEQKFSEMAHGILLSKMPHIAEDVVTFKILKSDVDTGSGVGAFVVMRSDKPIYVPVILSEGHVKPLEIMYFKETDLFLPFTERWLDEVQRLSMSSMGEEVEIPDTLNTDVDIRNVVVPPTTGRYSYAADLSYVANVFDRALVKKEANVNFLGFLSKAPNQVKEAMLQTLEERPQLLKKVAWLYGGVEDLATALRVDKTAQAAREEEGQTSSNGSLYIATKDTPAAEFEQVFGKDKGIAYQGVRIKGYYSKDGREGLNRAIMLQEYREFQEPKDQGGAYTFWFNNGNSETGIVCPDPINVFQYTKNDGMMPYDKPTYPSESSKPRVYKYQIFLPGGKYVCHQGVVVGEPVEANEAPEALVKKLDGDAEPKVGQTGCFVLSSGSTYKSTCCMKVKSSTKGSDGVQRYTVEDVDGSGMEQVISRDTGLNGNGQRVFVPKGGHVASVPVTWKWVALRSRVDGESLISDPKELLRWVCNTMRTNGADEVKVKKASADQYIIEYHEDVHRMARKTAHSVIDGIANLALCANIGVDDAEYAIKQADEHGVFTFMSAPNAAVEKTAAFLKHAQEPPVEGGGGEEAAPSPEEEAMMAEQAAMAQEPVMPSPTDLAVAEKQQQLANQMASIQQQMQMAQEIAMRAQEIAGGAPADPSAMAEGMGAPPAEAMGGPVDPAMQDPNMGMDPSMMGVDPALQGDIDPAMMQQAMMEQGMDPSMMGQQGMDPSMMGQDPAMMQQGMGPDIGATMGSMNEEGPVDPSQINPAFLEQAAGLDREIFDAAALSTLAQSPTLRELASSYVPALETALDNLGRILITLWMTEAQVKVELGNDTFMELEESLRNVFKMMGDLVLRLSKNALVMDSYYERDQTLEE